jgi:long-subunit acyl-CoA synthetase (AMP-forming)
MPAAEARTNGGAGINGRANGRTNGRAHARVRGPWDFSPDTTLPRLLAANAAAFPERIALREKDLGIWQQVTWREWLEWTLQCAAGLEALGFARGAALLVVGDNRPRLYTGLLAAGVLCGHPVPVYPDATPDDAAVDIHSSGTTGTPSGVVLIHRNVH